MLNIDKGAQPKGLIAYRKTPGAIYGGLGGEEKQALKVSLLREQGYLCCYCMRRIRLKSMKVEHWRPQSRYPDESLDYVNLLAACDGFESTQDESNGLCCDVHKADRTLKYNPADKTHDVESKLAYTGDGRIFAPHDAVFEQELDNKVLNLNLPYHRNNRRKVFEGVLETLGARPGTRTRRQLQSELKQWRIPNERGELAPYAGVVICYLSKKLASTE